MTPAEQAETRKQAEALFLSGSVTDIVFKHARLSIPNDPAFELQFVDAADQLIRACGSTVPAQAATLRSIAKRTLVDIVGRYPSVRGAYAADPSADHA